MTNLRKIPKSIFWLIADIVLLILFTLNIFSKIIFVYIQIRIILICIAPLILIFRMIKNSYSIAKKCGLVNFVLSIKRNKKHLEDSYKVLSNFSKFYIFLGEYILFIAAFMYSLEKAILIFTSSNNLVIFLTVISLNILFSVIEFYLQKRYFDIMDTFENSTAA